MVDGIKSGYNACRYPRLKRISHSPNDGFDLYIWMIKHSLRYSRSRLSPLTGGGEFWIPFAPLGDKEKMVAVFSVLTLGLVVPGVNPYLYGIPSPGLTGMHFQRSSLACNIQSNVEIVVIPTEIDVSERNAASYVHEIRRQIEFAPFAKLAVDLDGRFQLWGREFEIEEIKIGKR